MPVAHPFLFSVFPILSLLSSNVGEALPRETLLPLGIVLGLASILWLALAIPLRDPHKRALALSFFWLPFYTYGPLVDAAGFEASAEGRIGQTLAAFAAAAVALAVPTLVLRRIPRSLDTLTRPLNAAALVAVLAAGGTSLYYLVVQERSGAEMAMPSASEKGATADLPDIFYIIPDAYTRADYMKQAFGFDNRPFLGALEERGFYVAHKSRSNYMRTQMSLASSLNLQYLRPRMTEFAPHRWDAVAPVFTERIQRNRVFASLRARGYEIVAFPSSVVGTNFDTAERYIETSRLRLTEFQEQFIHLTMLRPLNPNDLLAHRVSLVSTVERMAEVERSGKPMFVFVHLKAPHEPHVVDEFGRPLDEPPPYHEGYVDAVKFVNKSLLRAIDATLARNPDTVFVVQGDHGPWTDWRASRPDDYGAWEGTWDDFVRDRTAILNAYYFPNRDYAELYPEITPVNSFRIIFRKYLGINFDPLQDASFVWTNENGKIVVVHESFWNASALEDAPSD